MRRRFLLLIATLALAVVMTPQTPSVALASGHHHYHYGTTVTNWSTPGVAYGSAVLVPMPVGYVPVTYVPVAPAITTTVVQYGDTIIVYAPAQTTVVTPTVTYTYLPNGTAYSAWTTSMEYAAALTTFALSHY